jgi:tRNA threonylcarbamoyladenosine modification (KEOPS) complex Cgi121 subunit
MMNIVRIVAISYLLNSPHLQENHSKKPHPEILMRHYGNRRITRVISTMCVQHGQAWTMEYGEVEELIKKIDGR